MKKKNGVDSPHLFLHCGFSLVASLAYLEEKIMQTNLMVMDSKWQAYLLLCGVTVSNLILLLQGILYGLLFVNSEKIDRVFLTLS